MRHLHHKQPRRRLLHEHSCPVQHHGRAGSGDQNFYQVQTQFRTDDSILTGRRNAAKDSCGPDDEEGLPPRQEDRPHGGDREGPARPAGKSSLGDALKGNSQDETQQCQIITNVLLQQDEVISWRELLEMGDSVPEEALDAVEESQFVNDACMLVYTSGIKKC